MKREERCKAVAAPATVSYPWCSVWALGSNMPLASVQAGKVGSADLCSGL
ncbi:hypothetical protein APA22_22550 [Acetobacter pasteurianus IFO 3283-22]|uniref:Uncharacterized protein n=1 Tax=Acetobacter pasteurianus (strain NBRC 105184 / IFO 3283-01) TaxID=634452 RepID=C7JEY0_ACEP3|nr:hypothetical protein APA01_22550 [Acetobacter pasteurianus IFO 3283-01]BAI03421.1 hypothetical protein APA03_22550 [Acetobacter pasteurianus IFO 3283-03]BAI06466.1 hypothetical protein APA07_22550 [Acetobacter pasteurianus IFO 3283-07]BAI09516.1 hypothetical protein APA22_22550 [Acetobacter pasteurianus IFO 3283-22]BAI12564.1 hypothetical protein APA26_22550 [Acetobacter pasteurianus IFO 3283-26]BAI15610.1 hypothetical protein APA32_22550 [Acetobacter pasteurianus IFO 3283-32]BAI18591.1 hy